MKFFEKLWNALGLFEYVETDEEIDELEEDNKPRLQEAKPAESSLSKKSRDEDSFWSKKPEPKPATNNIVTLPTSNKQMKVMVVTPAVFDDSQVIADHIRTGKPVVVYFEDTDPDVMKRIIDFISGTVYALKGTIQLVGTDIMVCAPQNVYIDANKDFFSKTDFEPWRN